MARIDTDEIASLVRDDRIHRRVYTDPEIFDLEMDRIFGRVWIYLAHESMVPRPGDFVRTRMGRHDVLVTRDRKGAIHVVRNSCAHRGAQLCRATRGNTRTFTCPYHGWSYHSDGRLAGLPHKQSYSSAFLADPNNHLERAPRVDSYRGFIFASWAPDGPSLAEHLGPMTQAIDNLVDRAPEGEIEQAGGYFEIEYAGNWKYHMENANDTLHPGFVHESSVASARNAEDDARTFDSGQTRVMLESNAFSRREWENVVLTAHPNGHSFMGGFYSSGILSPDTDDPVFHEYRAKLAAAHGEDKARDILAVDRFNNLIYPNISINAQYQQIRIIQPLAPDRTRMVTYCFRLKGAPEAMFQRAVRFLSNIGSPASIIFSDDVEIFARCQHGLKREGHEWVSMARGHDSDRVESDGLRESTTLSEAPVRAQFGAWLRHMTSEAAR